MSDVDWLSLIISAIAAGFAIGTFIINYFRVRKTEQIKLCIDISSRLDDAENKIFKFEDKLKDRSTTDENIRLGWKTNLRDANLLYLNHWEFFSFLVNIKEIQDEKMLDYFKENFKSGIEDSFNDYPAVRDSKEQFGEIKKLLKQWHPTYYSQHFELK